MISVHDKAIRLLEGGIVEIQGDWFSLIQLPEDFDDVPCIECELDSICRIEIADVCSECDAISNRNCILRLAHS